MICWRGSLLDQYLTVLDALALSLRWRCVRRHANEVERQVMMDTYHSDVNEAAKIAYQNGVESVHDE